MSSSMPSQEAYRSRKRLGLLFQDDEPEATTTRAKPFRRELSREEAEILARMDAVKTQMSKTIEDVGLSLENYFQHIPPEKLQQEIVARFQSFDLDNNGTLDRQEICEAMAEMGKRPSAAELDEFFTLFDTDKNGKIDLEEFEQMVRIKLHLLEPNKVVRSPSKSPRHNNQSGSEMFFGAPSKQAEHTPKHELPSKGRTDVTG